MPEILGQTDPLYSIYSFLFSLYLISSGFFIGIITKIIDHKIFIKLTYFFVNYGIYQLY